MISPSVRLFKLFSNVESSITCKLVASISTDPTFNWFSSVSPIEVRLSMLTVSLLKFSVEFRLSFSVPILFFAVFITLTMVFASTPDYYVKVTVHRFNPN